MTGWFLGFLHFTQRGPISDPRPRGGGAWPLHRGAVLGEVDVQGVLHDGGGWCWKTTAVTKHGETKKSIVLECLGFVLNVGDLCLLLVFLGKSPLNHHLRFTFFRFSLPRSDGVSSIWSSKTRYFEPQISTQKLLCCMFICPNSNKSYQQQSEFRIELMWRSATLKEFWSFSLLRCLFTCYAIWFLSLGIVTNNYKSFLF